MQYGSITSGIFIKRLNRFIACVSINGTEYLVHVRNTGRCREILLPGAKVLLVPADQPKRKTPFTLVAVYKGEQLVNIDSLAPNQLMYEALRANKIPEIGRVETVRKEVTFHSSRFDIYFESGDRRGFIEVKGVTLEKDGVTMFPDAPTERGAKHLREMLEAVNEGYLGYIAFVIQMKGVKLFTPNENTDPAFAAALRDAAKGGVKILAYDCSVLPGETMLGNAVPIRL
jgi:sugar fermentation stimulation protein A